MTYDPEHPFDDLPGLPPAVDVETRTVQLGHDASKKAAELDTLSLTCPRLGHVQWDLFPAGCQMDGLDVIGPGGNQRCRI